MAFRAKWPTQHKTITQRFGENPQIYSKFGLPGHEGIDFVAPEGSEIYAVAEGFISDIRLDEFSDPILKPYGNQVRIQHADGFESIYAHLSQAVVTRGQFIQGRQLIGLAGNTGNSMGAHLHLSLKKQGATWSGETPYPHDLVDPDPYLEPFTGEKPLQPLPPEMASMQVTVDSPETGFLNVRAAPYVGSELITQVNHNTNIDVLEDIDIARAKIGERSQWLWIRTATAQVGYVAAWYVKPLLSGVPAEPATTIFLTVDSPDDPLKLRQGPGTHYPQLTTLTHGSQVKALDSESLVKTKLGKQGQWIYVQAPSGDIGYVAAWYVKMKTGTQPVIPKPEPAKPTEYVIVESPDSGLRIRETPSTEGRRVWAVPHRTPLRSLEDPITTGNKVGKQDQWIRVRTPALFEGYCAAWYVRYPEQDDVRTPAADVGMQMGTSPHVFGIHALAVEDDPQYRSQIRGLFQQKNKKGWILFTQICGRHPDHIVELAEVRNRFWEWAHQGYGIIIRLNHGYEPGGTLPGSQLYDDFAAAAARWVEIYLKHPEVPADTYTWTLQIGNEQNNPREHPGGFANPTEHITANLYAQAFNKAYAAIKAVLPNATVCPGAVDPYNYMPMKLLNDARWRPLDYYTEMLDQIRQLDGVIVHAYTHGPDPASVTHLKRFGDGTGPLGDHYFDFQVYRQFVERIPAQWRDRPVYITEMNHIHRPAGEHDQGWLNQKTGWVREVYREIDRWNQTPYAQQIRCGLLYRWMGDQWEFRNKPEVLDDISEALGDERRWRTHPAKVAFAFTTPAEALRKAKEAPVQPLEERYLTTPDDLKVIKGIGEKSEAALHAAGILVYEQLARLQPEQISALIGETGVRARHIPSWPQQAMLALHGKSAELKRLQATL